LFWGLVGSWSWFASNYKIPQISFYGENNNPGLMGVVVVKYILEVILQASPAK
jgi:hypothetical protein